MTTFFETKEQFLTFRKAWAAASQAGTLQREHHLLYNIIRSKPITNGFTPITNTNKLQNGAYINHGLYLGHLVLFSARQHARNIVKYRESGGDRYAKTLKFYEHMFQSVIQPFLDHLPEQKELRGDKIIDLNYEWWLNRFIEYPMPSIAPRNAFWDKGQEVANKIFAKQITHDQIWAALMEG